MSSNLWLGSQANAGCETREEFALRVGEVIERSTHHLSSKSKQKSTGANRRAKKRESPAIEEENRENNRGGGLAKQRRGDGGEEVNGRRGKPDVHVENDVVRRGAVGDSEVSKKIDGEASLAPFDGNEFDEKEPFRVVVTPNETQKPEVLLGKHKEHHDEFAIRYDRRSEPPAPAIQELLQEIESVDHGHIDRRDFQRSLR